MARDVCDQFRSAAVVEPKSINQRAIFGQAKQSRLFVSALRLVRDGADFDEAEAQSAQRVRRAPILIETRGDSHWIRKRESKSFQFCEW